MENDKDSVVLEPQGLPAGEKDASMNSALIAELEETLKASVPEKLSAALEDVEEETTPSKHLADTVKSSADSEEILHTSVDPKKPLEIVEEKVEDIKAEVEKSEEENVVYTDAAECKQMPSSQ